MGTTHELVKINYITDVIFALLLIALLIYIAIKSIIFIKENIRLNELCSEIFEANIKIISKETVPRETTFIPDSFAEILATYCNQEDSHCVSFGVNKQLFCQYINKEMYESITDEIKIKYAIRKSGKIKILEIEPAKNI